MKICLLAQADCVHTMKWAKYFAERGYEVSLISFSEPVWNIKGLRFFKLKRIFSERLDFILNLNRTRKLLKEIKPDILHAHYATNYGLLGALSGFHPYILSVWGSDVFITPRRSSFHKKLVEFNLSKADVICSTSGAMAKETKKYLKTGREVVITPFGVNIDQFKPPGVGKNGNDIVVATVKALVKGKGYGTDLLIEIFSMACKKHGNLKLVIIGKGEHRKELKQLAMKLGVAGKIEFLGYIPHERLPEVMSKIDIYCCLSKTDNESFGVAPLEASACGKPVIVSNVGGLPEVAVNGETGFVVNVSDKKSIGLALEQLILDASLRHQMGQLGRHFVESRYNWLENARIMENVYEKVLNE